MKRVILKSVLSVALCSIVAMLTTSCSKDFVQENQFESVEFSPRGGKIYRWQQQLEWTAGAYKIVFPELELVGWRKAGVLNSKEAIENFVEDGLQNNKMFGHTVDLEKGIYEIAPRSELTQKYGVWGDKAIEIVKQQFIDATPVGAEIVELQWSYKGKPFTEAIAVINGKDELGNGIVFNTINQFLLVKDVPLADWQIEEREELKRKATSITPEEQEMIEEHMRKKRQNGNSTRTGIDGEEEPKNLQVVGTPHSYLSTWTVGGISVCDVSLIFVAEFDLNTATFNAWDVVIEKHNSAPGYSCDTDAMLTEGISGVSVAAKYIWGWAWGYTPYGPNIDVSRGQQTLMFSGNYQEATLSGEETVFCPMLPPEDNNN